MSDKYTWEDGDVQMDFRTDERLRQQGDVEEGKWHIVTAEEGQGMPEPKEGESENDYVARCIPFVKREEGLTDEQAAGKCHGMWRNANKAMGTVDTMAEGAEKSVPAGTFSEVEDQITMDSEADKGTQAKGRAGIGSVTEAREVGGYESPEPGTDTTEKEKSILAAAYASCRKDHPDFSKERCSKIAWGAVNNYRQKEAELVRTVLAKAKGDEYIMPEVTYERSPKPAQVEEIFGVEEPHEPKASRVVNRTQRLARVVQRMMVMASALKVGKALQVDAEQIYAGTCEELEHTDDWHKAMQTAVDHLSSDPDYYTKLEAAGLMDSNADGHHEALNTHEPVGEEDLAAVAEECHEDKKSDATLPGSAGQ